MMARTTPNTSHTRLLVPRKAQASNTLHESGVLVQLLQGSVLLALFLLVLPLTFAATYTDTLTADFSAGNISAVNVSDDAITLPLNSSGEYNSSGTFYSQVFDMGSNPSATIAWNYATPSGTSVLIATRFGNSSSVGSSWSSFSSDYGTSSGSTITITERFLQYRVQLTTSANTSTPSVTDVTLTYTEENVTASNGGSNLTSTTTGNYDLRVNASDTFSVTSVVGAYSVNSTTYTAVTLTHLSGDLYNLTIAEPSAGWDQLANQTITLYLNITTSNGSATNTHERNITELIDFVNTAPSLSSISNYEREQNETLNITISGSDADELTANLTFTTNRSDITITALTNTTARLTWIPGPEDVGTQVITVYVNDTLTRSSTTFTVNVTDINDAPEIDDVDAISSYYGVRQTLTLSASDADASDTLTFSMSPNFFSITTNAGNDTGEFFGVANWTPAYPERGEHNVTFFASDGTETVNTTTTMTIDYCGDAVCQTDYETSLTCEADCPATTLEQISLIIPDRNCVNETMTIYVFNATNRFSCYYEGLVEQGLALCEPIDGVTIDVYQRSGNLLVSEGSISSDSDGVATFTPTEAGTYKFTATKDDFSNTTETVIVRLCTANITQTQTNQTIEQPSLPPRENRSESEAPAEETPGLTQEEASVLTIILFYIVVPLLGASLLYTSVTFYDLNKDSVPWLLQLRIWILEKRKQYAPQIIWMERKLEPIAQLLRPAVQASSDTFAKVRAAINDRFKRR